jgi:hypothetical protein
MLGLRLIRQLQQLLRHVRQLHQDHLRQPRFLSDGLRDFGGGDQGEALLVGAGLAFVSLAEAEQVRRDNTDAAVDDGGDLLSVPRRARVAVHDQHSANPLGVHIANNHCSGGQGWREPSDALCPNALILPRVLVDVWSGTLPLPLT